MSQITVTERGLDDDREIAMTIMNTFYPRGLSGDERWGECDPDAVEAFFAAEERRFYETPYIRCFKAMLNGKTVGCATWDVIHDPVQARKEAKPMTPLPEGASEHAHFFKRALDYRFSLWTIPGIYLRVLVVLPEAQRKGVGKALLAWGIEQSDKLGLPAVLEASKAGFPVYKSLGFKEYTDPLHEGPGLFAAVMARPPRGSSLSLVPATSADVARLGHIYRRAFDPTSLNKAIFGNVDPKAFEAYGAEAIMKSLQNDQRSDRSQVKKIVIKAERAGLVLGFAIWEHHAAVTEQSNKTDKDADTVLSKASKSYPGGTNVELAKALFRRREPAPTYEYWHLAVLAVEPGFQSEHVGRDLLKWGIERASPEKLPVHLVATKDVISFYAKFGFVEDGPARVSGEHMASDFIRDTFCQAQARAILQTQPMVLKTTDN